METATVSSPPIATLVESSLIERPELETSPSLLTDQVERPVRLPLRRSFLEFRITGEEPKWLYPTLSSFQELLQLPQDWDSYGASVITDEAIAGAADVLVGLHPPFEVPQPDVVPGSSGSVQLEWHRSGADVEIHISSAGHVTAFLFDSGEDVEFETIDQEARVRLSRVLYRMAT